MAAEIYCYGGIDIYRDVFNAIAMLNGDRSFIHSLITIGVIVGAFWSMIMMIFGDLVKPFTTWILPMAVIQTAFLTPTSTVNLIDLVQAGRHETVDHVPYGLALVAGTLSRLSHRITEKTEVFFTLPDDLKYSRSGGIFAANLLENQKMMTIQDEDFAENMRSFIGQCVLYDLALGRKYTIKNLRNTPNIWGLISANASPARSFVWKEGFNRGDIITCAEGVTRFTQSWATHIDKTACAAGSKLYANHDRQSPMMVGGAGGSGSGAGSGVSSGSPSTCRSPLARQEFLKYLPLQYGVLAGMARTSTQIIQQQMMISAMVDAQDHASSIAGNAPNFAARKAYLQQRSSYETIGNLASDTLPIMRAVLELICYSLFLFIMPILVLPMGYRVLVAWAQTIVWLAMWPPMYAILHLIMISAISMKTRAFMGISNPNGITLASSLGVQNISADMAAMAGYLSLSIPFICIAIVKGVSSFVHMSSSLGGVSQGAASTAATEALTGTYSLGNTSMDNHSFGNMNMLSQNYDAGLSSGSFRSQEGHTTITSSAGGGMIASIEQSNLPISINMAGSIANNKRMAAHNELSTGHSMMQSAERSLGSSVEQLGNLGKTLSNSTNIQEGFTEQQQQEAGKSMEIVNQAVDRLAKDANISKGRAAEIMASVGSPELLNSIFGASVGSQLQSSSASSETISKAKEISQSMNFGENARVAMQASQHLSKHSSDDQIQSFAKNHQASLSETARDSQSAQKHFDASRRLSKEADTVESQSATINRNMNDKFIGWLANQEAPNSDGGIIGNRGAIAMLQHKPDEAQAYANQFVREQMPKASLGMSESSLQSEYRATPMSSSVDKGVVDSLDQKSKEEMSYKVGTKAFGMERRVEEQIEGATQFMKGAKEDIVDPRQAELQKDHHRQSTDVGIVSAIGGGLKAVKNTVDSPDRFLNEKIEDMKEGYTKLTKGDLKEARNYSDLPSMINTSIQSRGYPSSSDKSLRQDVLTAEEQPVRSVESEIKSASSKQSAESLSTHPRQVESLFSSQQEGLNVTKESLQSGDQKTNSFSDLRQGEFKPVKGGKQADANFSDRSSTIDVPIKGSIDSTKPHVSQQNYESVSQGNVSTHEGKREIHPQPEQQIKIEKGKLIREEKRDAMDVLKKREEKTLLKE